jgi:hypothetical protein
MKLTLNDGFGSFAVDTKASPYDGGSLDVVGYAESMQEQYGRTTEPPNYAKRLEDLFAALELSLAENKAGTFRRETR